MVPHIRTSENRWNPDSFVDLRRCHTGTGFEGRHFGKNRHVDYFVKGVRRFGVLKALLCRRLKTELPPPSFEGELMETSRFERKSTAACPPPSFEGELMETKSSRWGGSCRPHPPPSFEGELMETFGRQQEFFLVRFREPTTFVWRRTNGNHVVSPSFGFCPGGPTTFVWRRTNGNFWASCDLLACTKPL